LYAFKKNDTPEKVTLPGEAQTFKLSRGILGNVAGITVP
jgi:hypothetical protein